MSFIKKMKEKLQNIRKMIISEMREYSSLPAQQEEERPDLIDLTSVEKIKSIYGIASSIDVETLKLIERALDKIETGRYGICELCGVEIDRERLEEIPYVRYCVDCQHKVEIEEESSKLLSARYEAGYVSPEISAADESEEEAVEEEGGGEEFEEEDFEEQVGKGKEEEEEEIEKLEEEGINADYPVPEEVSEEIEKEIMEEEKLVEGLSSEEEWGDREEGEEEVYPVSKRRKAKKERSVKRGKATAKEEDGRKKFAVKEKEGKNKKKAKAHGLEKELKKSPHRPKNRSPVKTKKR